MCQKNLKAILNLNHYMQNFYTALSKKYNIKRFLTNTKVNQQNITVKFKKS